MEISREGEEEGEGLNYILRAWVRTYAFLSRGFMSPWRRAWGLDGDLSLYCTHTHGTAILLSLHFEALVEVPLRLQQRTE